MTKGRLLSSRTKFNPAAWPIERRRLIAWFGVAIIMLVLFIFWIYSLRLSLMREPAKGYQPLLDINQIRQDLSSGLEEVKQSSQLLKKITITTTSSTTDPEIKLLREQNKLQLDKLRQKLEQLPNQQSDK
jgi:preprotein translocase subunit SecF